MYSKPEIEVEALLILEVKEGLGCGCLSKEEIAMLPSYSALSFVRVLLRKQFVEMMSLISDARLVSVTKLSCRPF